MIAISNSNMDNNQRGEHLKLIEGGSEQLPSGKLAPNYSPMSIIIKTATVLMVEMMMMMTVMMMIRRRAESP